MNTDNLPIRKITFELPESVQSAFANFNAQWAGFVRSFKPFSDRMKILKQDLKERIEWNKTTYPLGFDCFLLLLKKNQAYKFKLRKATKKYLTKHKCSVNYRYESQEYRLFHNKLREIPEDFFLSKFANTLDMSKTPGEMIRDLDNLPSRVWDSLRDYLKTNYKIIENADSSPEILEKLPFLDFSYSVYYDLRKSLLNDEWELIKQIDIEGHTQAEIAKRQGRARQSINEKYKRAKRKARKILSKN